MPAFAEAKLSAAAVGMVGIALKQFRQAHGRSDKIAAFEGKSRREIKRLAVLRALRAVAGLAAKNPLELNQSTRALARILLAKHCKRAAPRHRHSRIVG